MRMPTRSRARLYSTAALAAGVAAMLGHSPTPAMAQDFFFWSGETLRRLAPAMEPRRIVRPRPARARKASPTADDDGAKPAREAKAETQQLDRPLFLIASIADQRVSIYNHHGLVVRSAISTGVPGHPTPKGIFTIIGRERFHRSNIYSSAPMPFMQRVTWSGIAMHLGVVPGRPASHGCIRLPAAFAAKLWGMTRIGERIVISPHDVTPAEFDHALLPQPKLLASAEAEKGESAIESGQAQPGAPVAAQPQGEKPEAEADGETVASITAAPDPQQIAAVEADTPSDDPQPQAEQTKTDAGADKAEPSVSPPKAAAERPTVNPHQYALRLKAKAKVAAAAASATVKALTAEVGAKRIEAGRAEAELSAAEAAEMRARARAESAAASYEAAAASVASQQEPAEMAERSAAAAGDAPARAKADRLTRAFGRALIAQEAALQQKTSADAALAEAAAKLEQARTDWAAKDSAFADADRRLDEARTQAAAAIAAQKEAERRVAPLSILISKKDRRIYVRQALAPLFDAPIEIRDPTAPLGSHLYIATAASEVGTSLKWRVVSMPTRLGDEPGEGRRTASAENRMSWNVQTSPSPTEALERVDIPKDIRDRIAERLWTGASLIISDQPVSSETGAVGTDLTIKLR